MSRLYTVFRILRVAYGSFNVVDTISTLCFKSKRRELARV